MPAVPLPDNPSLEQLRKQAKDLRDLARAGVPGALDLVAAHHPDGAHQVGLAGAQLVVACLRYGDDVPARRERAARLLADQPGITRPGIHVAAAAADEAAVRALLRAPFLVPGGRPSWARTSEGRTPAEVAALAGCPQVAEWLVAQGAARPAGAGADGLIAAVLAGDRDAAGRLRAHAGTARAQRPGLIVWAAARRSTDAIVLLAELGFDVKALARTDIPMEQSWETALHEAAAS
ncbi:MAG: hypothetical protein ACRDMI_02615 [Streptosporangiaceae bacterium]